MLFFLLATLLIINKVDNTGALLYSSTPVQQGLVNSFFEEGYGNPNHIFRPPPPLAKSPWVAPNRLITASSAVVVDLDSGTVLWQKNAEAVSPLASLTKLVTALVFLKNKVDFSQEIEIIESDNSNAEGSRLYVKAGEKVTVGDLFYASLVGSANNATKALARSTGLSEQEFIAQMDELAGKYALLHTVFYDVTGLDPRNTSTVKEYAQLAQYALNNMQIRDALTRKEYIFETIDRKITHKITNTDKLLNDSEINLVGAKTGFINEAGFTFVCQSELNGKRVMVLLFNCSTGDDRFAEAKALISWAYGNYNWL
ncbi:MAG: serine hydrolase [Patescibacteria group bacterium]|jgi:D-alanyl-D-alanine carboxypeptidase